MALDALKPTHIQKRFKALFYGGPGVGKTLTSIKFPRPYVIDTEGGCENDEYVDILNKGEGVILKTLDYDQILKNIKSLRTEKHQFKTVIIDSITYLYQSLLEEAESNPRIKEGFGGYYKYANSRLKRIILNLLKLDMNVIVICHSKDKYSLVSSEMAIEGKTPDGPKNLSYMFDVVLQIEKNKKLSQKSNAIVEKSRVKKLQEGLIFEFNFLNISEKYGKETFIRDAVPVKLATEEQLKELDLLINKAKVSSSMTHKWLKKANVETFDEMTSDIIQKCIEYIHEKYEIVDEEEDIKLKMVG